MGRDRSSDAGNVQVLEAVLVAIIMLTAVTFVLTFDAPAGESVAPRDNLAQQGESAVKILYDRPLSNPAYGNSTISKYVAEAIRGEPGNLTRALNNTLPPGVAYNVYLNNGYGLFPVYETRDPGGETVSVTRPLRPQWTYTFLSTDVDVYPVDTMLPSSRYDDLKMRVFGLPVIKDQPLMPGGDDLRIIVSGDITYAGDTPDAPSQFSLKTSHNVYQGSATTHPPVPYATVTWVDPAGAVITHRDVADLPNGTTVWLDLQVSEWAGVKVPEGTELTIHAPRGWTVKANDTAYWDVTANKTGEDAPGALRARLLQPLKGAKAPLEVNATYEGDAYDWYILTAELSSAVQGRAELAVKAKDSLLYTGGDYPDAYVTMPTSMGSGQWGPWGLVVTNPTSWDSDTRIMVDTVRVEQPDGRSLFAEVRNASSPAWCDGEWAVESGGAALVWESSNDCVVGINEALNLTFEVRGSGVETEEAALQYAPQPPVEYGNGWAGSLQRPVAPGFFMGDLPPRNDEYGGYVNAAGDHGVNSTFVHREARIDGGAEYSTGSLNDYKNAITFGYLDVAPHVVPIGESVAISNNVKSLALDLSNEGFAIDVKTHIYAPWSMGQRIPMKTFVHEEQTVASGDLVAVAVHDLTGNGKPDVIVASDKGKVTGLRGVDGAELSGYQIQLPGETITAFKKVEHNATSVAFLVGTNGGVDRNGRTLFNLRVYDESFNLLWRRGLGVTQSMPTPTDVYSVSGVYDYNDDGTREVVAGVEGGDFFLLDGATGNTIWEVDSQGAPVEVAEGIMGLAAEETAVATRGAGASAGTGTIDLTNPSSVTSSGVDFGYIAQQPSVHFWTHALEGYNASGEQNWGYGGGGFEKLETIDLDGDGVTDMVAGDWQGLLHTINGTQGAVPYNLWQIAVGNTIVDMEALDRDHVYTISRDGVLMYTNDSWVSRVYHTPPGDPTGLVVQNFPLAGGLDYINETHGWIAGDDGKVWYTTDGGVTFTPHVYTLQSGGSSLTASNYHWSDILWPESPGYAWETGDHGLLYGGDCATAPISCSAAFIAYTEDGGETWNASSLTGAVKKSRVNDVHLFSAWRVGGYDVGTGYAAGHNGTLWVTSDGGVSWSRQVITIPNEGAVKENMQALHFFSETRGVLVGDGGKVVLANRSGSSWTFENAQVPPGITSDLMDVTFIDDENGWVVGRESTVLRTYDGGETWVTFYAPVPEDEAAGYDYMALAAIDENAAWFGGGATTAGGTRLIGFFEQHLKTSQAQTVNLTDFLTPRPDRILKATVKPQVRVNPDVGVEYSLSNDGCASWVAIPPTYPNATLVGQGEPAYEMTRFADQSKNGLCLRVTLHAGPEDGEAYFTSPVVEGVTIHYVYEWFGGTFHANYTVPLTSWYVVDEENTTARWDRGAGDIRAPYIDKFWYQQVGGEVTAITTGDFDGDGDEDVVAGTGDRWLDGDRSARTGTDRRLYLFDGPTGQLLRKTDPLPGKVVAVSKAQLTGLTGDAIPDLLVTLWNPDAPDEAGNLTAVNGSNFQLLWRKSHDLQINAVTSSDLDLDGRLEAVSVTSNSTAEGRLGEVNAHHADQSPVELEWRNFPELEGRYTVDYPVPMNALYGPYVVETEVTWRDDATPWLSMGSRIYDYFVVTPPDGRIPPSTIYRLEVVMWYEDWG